MKKALILFAKVPRPGVVKTRLQPDLSPEQARQLYLAFVLDLLEATGRLRNTVRIMGCDSSQQDPFFRSLAERYHLTLMDQRGTDLGERMRNAIVEAQGQGFGPVVIIGTDSPTLPMENIRKAFTLLRTHDLVLGPSHDGGYYLIGCGRGVPPIFEGIPWGTDQVLGMTLRKVVDLKIRCALLPFWYDVDTVRDLRLLSAHLDYLELQDGGAVAPETARIVKALKW